MSQHTIAIKYGRLRGIAGRDKSITVYRGIPYAQPPVGALRWREPRPVVPWYGIRDADHFGGICPQKSGQFMEVMPLDDYFCTEDCLYLNVFVPEKAENCPVFVWFHGGAFQGGHGSDAMFDGEEFARLGVVVVTVNYRLGIMGFFAHPEMRAESPYGGSGNFGVLDQIRSLEWVRDNIAAFGGDPGNVTIGGQSAGGGSVCNMIASPLAKGLFVRAIIESGDRSVNDPNRPHVDMESLGVALAKKLGDGSLRSMRDLPVNRLVRMDYDAAIEYTGKTFSPWVDGAILPVDQSECLRSKQGNNVPMLVGSNLDEGSVGPRGASYADAMMSLGEFGKKLSEAYPEGSTPRESAMLLTQMGAAQWKLRLSVWAEKRAKALSLDTWQYQFCYRSTVDGIYYPACHSAELIYVWRSMDCYPDGIRGHLSVKVTDEELGRITSRYWCNFISTGNPNSEGLPYWTSKRESPDSHMRLDAVCAMEPDIVDERERLFLPELRRAFALD